MRLEQLFVSNCMNKIKAIILDFDGVIVESNQEKTLAFNDLFKCYPPYQDTMMAYHLANFSTSRMTKFEHFVYKLMERPKDIDSVKKMAQQFSELVMHRVIACPSVSGAQDFLEEFSKQLPLYVSSATPHDELKEIAHSRGLTTFFKQIYGDPPYKKKEAIRLVLEREQLPPDEVIFIGDSVSDYMAAKETGVEFIGRNSGLSFDAVVIDLYGDLYEIADIVRKKVNGG